MDEAYIELGIIKRVHGLKGEVVAFLYFPLYMTDQIRTVFVQLEHTLVPYRVAQAQLLYDDQAVIKFKGIDDRTMAYSIKGKTLFIRKEDFPEQVITEEVNIGLISYQVFDMQQTELGTVERIENLSMQTLLVVNYLSKELLIPYNPALIHDIDHASKKIVVDLPSGFIEAVT